MNVETCLNFRKELMHQRDVAMELLGALDAFAAGRFATWDLRVRELGVPGIEAAASENYKKTGGEKELHREHRGGGTESTEGLAFTIPAEALNPVFQEVRVDQGSAESQNNRRDEPLRGTSSPRQCKRLDGEGVPVASVVRGFVEERKARGLAEFGTNEVVEFVARAMPRLQAEEPERVKKGVRNGLYVLKNAGVIVPQDRGRYVLAGMVGSGVGKKSYTEGNEGAAQRAQSPEKEARQESRPTRAISGSRDARTTEETSRFAARRDPTGPAEKLSARELAYREFRSGIKTTVGVEQ